jgi:peptide/nickel transport system permease protein
MAVLALVWLVTFIITYMLPADPARAFAGIRASQADVARIRQAFGLDQPLVEQMALYAQRLASGDLGFSFTNRRQVLELLSERLPATIHLAFAGLVAQLAIGLPIGVLAAVRRGRPVDRAAAVFSSVTAAMPGFWLGYLLLLWLAFLPTVELGLAIFPLSGSAGDLRSLFLPALTLGLIGSAYYVRLMRASLIDELRQGYLLTARAKGLSERRVVLRHALRNALSPVVAQLGLDMGILLGGVVVVERVFSWPGIGDLAVEAAMRGDLPVIMGAVLAGAVFIVLANLAADVANALIDPRIRYAQ